MATVVIGDAVGGQRLLGEHRQPATGSSAVSSGVNVGQPRWFRTRRLHRNAQPVLGGRRLGLDGRRRVAGTSCRHFRTLRLPGQRLGQANRERSYDRFRVAVDHRQQHAGGPVRNPAALFPILDGPHVETETVREFLSAELQPLANGDDPFGVGSSTILQGSADSPRTWPGTSPNAVSISCPLPVRSVVILVAPPIRWRLPVAPASFCPSRSGRRDPLSRRPPACRTTSARWLQELLQRPSATLSCRSAAARPTQPRPATAPAHGPPE